MTTNELLEVLRANAYGRTAFAGTVIVPRVVLEEAITKITELALKTDAVPLAKALGDLQRNYAAAVGDFLTINGSLQLRNGELVRKGDKLSQIRSELESEIFKLKADLAALKPAEPKFKIQTVVIQEPGEWPVFIDSVRMSPTYPPVREYRSRYSGVWIAEGKLRALTTEEKG